MIGGVLTEKTVKDVVPNLEDKKTKINGITEHLHKELKKAGEDLIKYKVKQKTKTKKSLRV